MNYSLSIIFLVLFLPSQQTLFDFNVRSNLSDWRIVDDVVMGGRSDGNFAINDEGHGIFYGKVSLKNNGGFSSVRYRFETMQMDDYKKISLRLKGDGKRYQFRIKTDSYDRHSYITYFETNGEWQTIEFKLADLFPRWRGMQLEMPNYPGETMEEIAFLIANNQNESFMLEIDRISLK
jgi:hypothetical protein